MCRHLALFVSLVQIRPSVHQSFKTGFFSAMTSQYQMKGYVSITTSGIAVCTQLKESNESIVVGIVIMEAASRAWNEAVSLYRNHLHLCRPRA